MRSDRNIAAALQATAHRLRLGSLAILTIAAASCSLLPTGDVHIETEPGLPFVDTGEEICLAVLKLELVGARVVERGDGIGLVLRDGRELTPVWPRGSTAERTDSGVTIHHRDGTVLARTGEIITLGGSIEGDRVEICAVDPYDPSVLEGLDTPEP